MVVAAVAAVVVGALLIFLFGLSRSGLKGVLAKKVTSPIGPTGPEGMVGESAVVTREVGDLHAGGLVRGRGEDWPAYTEQPHRIAIGTKVILLSFHRGRFLVAEEEPSLGL
jgi:membrane protein implicated in regulation of membrane protease activity